MNRIVRIIWALGVLLVAVEVSAQELVGEQQAGEQQAGEQQADQQQTGEQQAMDQAEPPFAFGPQPGWQILAGPTGGASFGSPGGGGFIGAELSVSRLDAGWWLGGYVDAAYDFGQSAALVTAGPEFGYTFVGLDGGLAAHIGDGGASFGPQGRLMLSAGFFTLFGRYTYLLESDAHIGQAGLIFKLPVWADN